MPITFDVRFLVLRYFLRIFDKLVIETCIFYKNLFLIFNYAYNCYIKYIYNIFFNKIEGGEFRGEFLPSVTF